MTNLKNALETFQDLENEDLYDLILGLADDNPEFFMDVVDALEVIRAGDLLQWMREETHNGYPLYPELQLSND